jgi:hypothetical protein
MPKIKFRGFISLVTTFTFIVSLVSGIILYFTPQGKIARWTHWTFWELDKYEWEAVHINSSLVFLIVCFFHIYFNWNPLIGYIKKRAKMALNLKLEMAISVVLTIYIFFGSLYNFVPFGIIMKWNGEIKDHWEGQTYAKPPISSAEKATVQEFCEELGVELEIFYKSVSQNGWQVNGDSQTLNEIAETNNISAADIYQAVSENRN